MRFLRCSSVTNSNTADREESWCLADGQRALKMSEQGGTHQPSVDHREHESQQRTIKHVDVQPESRHIGKGEQLFHFKRIKKAQCKATFTLCISNVSPESRLLFSPAVFPESATAKTSSLKSQNPLILHCYLFQVSNDILLLVAAFCLPPFPSNHVHGTTKHFCSRP